MSILSLAPPLAVFIIGFATRKMRLALAVGIIISALIATQVDLLASLQLALHHFMNALEIGQGGSITDSLFSDRLSILSCLIFFGILTEIICQSNAAAAFQAYSRSFVSDKRSAESSCIALSLILCIDDYLSAIVVGSVMQPIASRFAIAKAKLAYLCNSLSSPVAAMIPFSSWAAAIIGTLMESGIGEHPTAETVLIGSPYAVLLNMIPYMLYSLALLTSVIFMVRKETSYGCMREKEVEAAKSQQNEINQTSQHQGCIWDFTLPIASLLCSILVGLLYSGDYALLGGNLSFFDAILSARVSQTLLGATALASFVSLFYYIARGTFQWKDCPSLFWKGCQLMTSAILMLSLTWTLTGLMKEELHTGTYIASLIGDWIPLALLPLITFWLASVTFFLMGSSWGTMAILMPIIVSMIAKLHATTALATGELATAFDIPVLLPTLAAVVSGSVFGNHVSLISDTSLMAASSTGCDLLDHFKTKFMYGLPIFFSCSAGFLATGFFPSAGALLPVTLAIGLTLSLMLIWQKMETQVPLLEES